MTITPDNYLDLGNLLLNELFGDIGIFLIIGMISITYTAIKYRIPAGGIVLLNILFAVSVISYLYNPLIWMILLLISGLLTYFLIGKIFRGR